MRAVPEHALTHHKLGFRWRLVLMTRSRVSQPSLVATGWLTLRVECSRSVTHRHSDH
jgi:hypothetical protein